MSEENTHIRCGFCDRPTQPHLIVDVPDVPPQRGIGQIVVPACQKCRRSRGLLTLNEFRRHRSNHFIFSRMRSVAGCLADPARAARQALSLSVWSEQLNDSSFVAYMLNRIELSKVCYYCRCSLNRSNRTIDHLLPFSRGGSNDPANRRYCCNRCNHLKGALTEEEFQRYRSDERCLKIMRTAAIALVNPAQAVRMAWKLSEYADEIHKSIRHVA